ncbi:MAG TPA: YdeI/OmpD-associated family protein [Dehalococcoidia bacterium]|nr:YdeI/OmpD-associated family protein [Dehalococcoidia bacterium]
MSGDLTTALDRDTGARRFFEGWSYSNKRRLVLAMEDAKTAETGKDA